MVERKIYDLKERFLELPLASLEDFWPTDNTQFIHVVNPLEQAFGIFVGDLTGVTDQQILLLPNIGRKQLMALKGALRQAYETMH